MRFHRLSKLLLTALLAASLPLRIYAAPCEPPMARGAQTQQSAAPQIATPQSSAHHRHCAQSPAAHHGAEPAALHPCGHGSPSAHGAACDCCCMTVAAAPPSCALPHDPAGTACARLVRHSPVLTLDRLDRPPRQAA
jgi:hypothetical protein